MTIGRHVEGFQYFNFETDFLENKNITPQNWSTAFQSKALALKTFPYKTAISKANVKTNNLVSTKWAYRKEWSFVSNYFIFSKNFFSLRTSDKELI